MIGTLCAPYSISGHTIVIGASIGIAVIDQRAGGSADIMRYADMALYRAKNEGRNRACIYDAAMDADLSHRKLLEGDLLHASAESLERYVAKQNRYTTLQADALHASGKRSSALTMALSPLARFVRFYVLRLGFLDGAPGFAHIAIGAFASFLKHAKLRALERAARSAPEVESRERSRG